MSGIIGDEDEHPASRRAETMLVQYTLECSNREVLTK